MANASPAAASYAAAAFCRDGRRIDIRALHPEDRDQLAAAFKRISSQTVYRRFFAIRRNFSEAEVTFFTNVDFAKHVALVALIDEGGTPTIVGAGRYVMEDTSGCAEVAFTVIDAYQGQGIGGALLRHIIAIARNGGLTTLVAEVLPENKAMLKVFKREHPNANFRHDGNVVHVAMDLIAEHV